MHIAQIDSLAQCAQGRQHATLDLRNKAAIFKIVSSWSHNHARFTLSVPMGYLLAKFYQAKFRRKSVTKRNRDLLLHLLWNSHMK